MCVFCVLWMCVFCVFCVLWMCVLSCAVLCACVCCAYERSYGFAIILLTVLVKAATYPLTKKQVGCGGVPGGLSGRSFCPNDGSSSSSSSVRLSLPHLERRPFVSRRWSRR